MSYEIALDNCRLQIHCEGYVPPPHDDIVLDLPAYHVFNHDTDTEIGDGTILSVADGTAIDNSLVNFDITCYGNGPGAPSSISSGIAGFFPNDGDVPDGYTLSSAALVVVGYVESDEAASPSPFWSGMDPYPTRLPFLSLDHTTAFGDIAVSGFPVGGYDGEIVIPNIFKDGHPVKRCSYNWETDFTVSLFIDYLAARATYVWTG